MINFRERSLLPHFCSNEFTFILLPRCIPRMVPLQFCTRQKNNPLTNTVTGSSHKTNPPFRTFRCNEKRKTNPCGSASSSPVQSSVARSLSLNISLLLYLNSNSGVRSLCKRFPNTSTGSLCCFYLKQLLAALLFFEASATYSVLQTLFCIQ